MRLALLLILFYCHSFVLLLGVCDLVANCDHFVEKCHVINM